jgi:hypothetical protein
MNEYIVSTFELIMKFTAIADALREAGQYAEAIKVLSYVSAT